VGNIQSVGNSVRNSSARRILTDRFGILYCSILLCSILFLELRKMTNHQTVSSALHTL